MRDLCHQKCHARSNRMRHHLYSIRNLARFLGMIMLNTLPNTLIVSTSRTSVTIFDWKNIVSIVRICFNYCRPYRIGIFTGNFMCRIALHEPSYLGKVIGFLSVENGKQISIKKNSISKHLQLLHTNE